MNYLSPQEILYIHSRIVNEFSGKHGVEDTKVLKKAVSYIHSNDVFPDKFKKAGGLFFAISKKRPFADLNLETALFVLKIFLDINKSDFDLRSEKVRDFIKNNLKNAKLEEITEWIKENSKVTS